MTTNKSPIKPGKETSDGMKLYVKDADDNVIGEITVPAGHRVPPTRIEGAQAYTKKK